MNELLDNSDSINDILPDAIDAKINVSISNDKLQAIVNISPPKDGGMGPSNENLMKEIVSNKIIYGIDKLSLLYMCKEPVYDTDIIIARGIEPIHGIDGSFEILFNIIKKLKPKQREDGRDRKSVV